MIMLLTNKGDNITIYHDAQSAVIRESTNMAGRNIIQKTTINLIHTLPNYNTDTIIKSSKLSIGQTVHLIETSGQGTIIEIRVGHSIETTDHTVELLVEFDDGIKNAVDYTQVI